MEKETRTKNVIRLLKAEYKEAKTALNFRTPHELLVATILSAQSTDKMINIVTRDLFKKYKNVADFANAKQEKLEQDIRSTGFFRNKAKNVIASAKMIVEKFGSKVPEKMDELITLPGVARKTANVVLYNSFGKNEGIAVDTHVIRLSQRLGLSKNDKPEKIESDLMKNTAQNEWGRLSNLLILHGRNICTSRNPNCKGCVLNKICPSAFTFEK